MAEALRANIDWKSSFFVPTGSVWPYISSRRGRPHQPFFSQNKAKRSFMWYKNVGTTFFRFVTQITHKRTDRQTYTFLV